MKVTGSNSSVVEITEQYLAVLFKKYFVPLCMYARQFIDDNEKVKDIVQDVFLNVWEKQKIESKEDMIKSYLYVSVRNRCLNFIRDNKKIDSNADVSEMHRISNDTPVEYKELLSAVQAEIDNLPEKCREIFLLSRFEELKYQEIADKLEISIKTVEAQMSKALKILRERFGDYLKILLIIFFKMY